MSRRFFVRTVIVDASTGRESPVDSSIADDIVTALNRPQKSEGIWPWHVQAVADVFGAKQVAK